MSCPICKGTKAHVVVMISTPMGMNPVVVACGCCRGTGEASEDAAKAHRSRVVKKPVPGKPFPGVKSGFRAKLIVDNDRAPGEHLFELNHEPAPTAPDAA